MLHTLLPCGNTQAYEEGKKYTAANLAAKGDNKSVPPPSTWKLSDNAKYVHYCDNETIGGVEFKSVPDVGGRLLISDMSSNFISKPVDVAKYGIIYAGAGCSGAWPAGCCWVAVRRSERKAAGGWGEGCVRRLAR